jgi:hypothetical protein
MYSFYSQIMSYIFNMLICLGMILLDNLIQYLLFIAIIDLSKTCRTASTLIYDVLVMFMIYPWIRIKLKMLIFLTMLLQPSVFEIAILQEGHCLESRRAAQTFSNSSISLCFFNNRFSGREYF